MIVYSKSWWGLPLLFRLYGSAFPRAMPFALFSALVTLLLKLTAEERIRESWVHPYPYQTYAFIVGFIIVFRSNFSYQRYWEGRTNLQLMTSRWVDCVIQVTTFDQGALPADPEDPEEVAAKARKFQETFVHLMSLLHALALQNLRYDWELGNLIPHDSQHALPPTGTTQDRRTAPEGQMAPGSPVKPTRQTRQNLDNVGKFRAVDLVMLRSSRAHQDMFNASMPLSVVGDVSQAEKRALGGATVPGERADNVDLKPMRGGWDERQYVPSPHERVHVVMRWVQQIVMERLREGGVAVPAPLLTRIYVLLSDGMLGYEQCRKLNDTPFPFAWAQMILGVLLVYALSVPFVMCAFIRQDALAVVITFAAVVTYFSLNEVARDMEDPFRYDPSELPFARIQWQVNERLLALSKTVRPVSYTEVGSLEGPHNLPTSSPAHMLAAVDDIQRKAAEEAAATLSTGTAHTSGGRLSGLLPSALKRPSSGVAPRPSKASGMDAAAVQAVLEDRLGVAVDPATVAAILDLEAGGGAGGVAAQHPNFIPQAVEAALTAQAAHGDGAGGPIAAAASAPSALVGSHGGLLASPSQPSRRASADDAEDDDDTPRLVLRGD